MTAGQSADLPRRRHARRGRRPARFRLALIGGLVVALAGTAAVAAISPWSDSQPDVASAGETTGPPVATAPGSPPAAVEGADPGPGSRGRRPESLPAGRAGFPDASSTGVPEGVSLRRSGTVTVDQDGAVVENLLVVDGTIEVHADNVTIRNVRVTNDHEFVQWGIIQREGSGGLVVEDSEIFGNGTRQLATGIDNGGGMLTVRRVEIHSITDGIMTSHGRIEDSYLHSPTLFEGDHTDMVQTVGGSTDGLPLEIVNNTLINNQPQTAAILLDNETGHGQVPVRGVLIEGNLLAGGGYTLYGGGFVEEGHDPSGIVVRNNVFSRELWPDGGFYGPVAYFDVTAPGNVWSGNVWDDGTRVEPGREG